MNNAENPPVDVEAIMTRIRQESARRAISGGSPSSQVTTPAFNRVELFQTINRAEQNARVGTQMPEMNRFSRRVRWMARTAARIMIYLTQVITTPQRMFNQSVVQAFHQVIRIQDQQIEQLEESLAQVARGLSFQQRELTRLVAETQGTQQEPTAEQKLVSDRQLQFHLLDPLYAAFEDQFRGKPEDIRESLKIYLPLIREAGAGQGERPVLDLGCGRGEWLALLADSGLQAKGVDLNRLLVQEGSERGLSVAEADIFAYLKGIPEESLGAVTAFHLIEHIGFDALIALLDEILRVLKPGGIAILETPNARHLLVSGGDFYRDPTHRNPIHPDTLVLLARSRGLSGVGAYFLMEEKDGRRMQPAKEYHFEKLMDYVRVSRDFALVGYRR